MKKSDVLDLIKYHYEGRETEFRNQSIAIARNFNKHGDTQLAQYIMGLMSQSDRFMPQIENPSEYLTPAKLDIGPLPLPLSIMNDLKGIINAVNHHIGINKFLFVGSPGTGKTESVKQVARLIGKELLVVDFSHLVDSKLGQTVKNLATLFNEINNLPFKQNYIILFDEIDSIVLDRVNQNDLREMGRVTSAFLKELDRLSPEIVLIATTNLFENLDKAVTRRFDAIIDFDRYTDEDKVEVATIILNELLKQFKNVARDLKLFKKIILWVLGGLLLGALVCFWSNFEIESKTQNFVTDDIEKLPSQKVGVLLGTSKTLPSGYKNYYFYYRIDAAEKLYKSGKIEYIIVSGDNSRKDYNEPEDMKNELINRGIPADKIYEDFAGFRTLDSVVRAKEIFGQNSYIIISQKFHNERAVYLAQKNGIQAFGFNAKDVNKYAGIKTKIREYLARTKVFVDFFIGKEPKFGGEKIEIK